MKMISHLFDVECDYQRDSSYQGQQGAVVDPHPGHRLPIHQIQDVERDQEALLPGQPGEQGRGAGFLQKPGRKG